MLKTHIKRNVPETKQTDLILKIYFDFMPQFEISLALSAIRTTKGPVQRHTCCFSVPSSLLSTSVAGLRSIEASQPSGYDIYINTTCLWQQSTFRALTLNP